ncbi:MAG: tetratricopeptide repeat protein [Methanolobus sp.]|uniref:tetratricopeptide repeat protein n=1 Tax=Methanolobus sp. TaxID=1874737 RepID=UPI00273209BB|nr:tetratricopeptide repeat protein [Methanolobus sp.]MDP2217998.1 tetratricopeptide repeat protein [Methanolobus sp.]
MSKQLADSIKRSLRSVSQLTRKGDYRKALKVVEKAERDSKDENLPEFIHIALLLKGRLFEACGQKDEALDIYEEALDQSSELFLQEQENIQNQAFLLESLGHIANILDEMGVLSLSESICEKNEGLFETIYKRYSDVIADNPKEVDYLKNYSKTMKDILTIYMLAQIPERPPTLVAETMNVFEKALKLDPDDSLLSILSYEMVEQYGKVCLDNGNVEKAKQVYDRLQEIYQNILEIKPEDEDYTDMLGSTYVLFVEMYEDIGEIEKAHEYSRHSLDIVEAKLLKNPDDPFYIRSRMMMHLKIGMLSSAADDYNRTRSYCEKTLSIFENLLEDHPDYIEEETGDFTNVLDLLAELFEGIGLFEEAKKCYMHEIDIYNSLIDQGNDEADNLLSVAATYNQMADLSAQEKDIEKAKEYYEKEITIYDKLIYDYSEDPENLDYEIFIADSLNSLGNLYLYTDIEAAKQYYEMALDIYERLNEEVSDDTELDMGFVKCLQNLAKVYEFKKEYATAISLLQQAAKLQQGCISTISEDWIDAKELGSIYTSLANVLDISGEVEMSEQFHLKAAEIMSQIISDDDIQWDAKNLLAMESQLQGGYYLSKGKYGIAKPYIEVSLTFYKNAIELDPTDPEYVGGFFSSLHYLGLLDYNAGYSKEAIDRYKTSFALMGKLIEASPDDLKLLDNAVGLYSAIGAACCVADELETSKQAFEQSMALQRSITAKDPDHSFEPEWEAIHLKDYAMLLFKLGEIEEAAAYSAKAEEKRREASTTGSTTYE